MVDIKDVCKTVDDVMELYPDSSTEDQVKKTIEWLKDNKEKEVCNDSN